MYKEPINEESILGKRIRGMSNEKLNDHIERFSSSAANTDSEYDRWMLSGFHAERGRRLLISFDDAEK